MEKPRPSVGMGATGFRIALESNVGFVGSWDKGAVGLSLPSISVQTRLCLEHVLSSNSPPILLSFQPFCPPLRSFVALPAACHPNSQPTSRKFTNILAPLRSPVQARTASRSVRFLSSESSAPLWNQSRGDICLTLRTTYHVPRLHPPSTLTLIHDLVPLLRRPMTISIR